MNLKMYCFYHDNYKETTTTTKLKNANEYKQLNRFKSLADEALDA